MLGLKSLLLPKKLLQTLKWILILPSGRGEGERFISEAALPQEEQQSFVAFPVTHGKFFIREKRVSKIIPPERDLKCT